MATSSTANRPEGNEGQEPNPGQDSNTDVLKGFIQVVQSVIPLLDKMKSSIEESSNRIPRASLQLNDVTKATESATVEILDVLDSITRRMGEVEEILRHLAERKRELQEAGSRISQLLNSPKASLASEDVPELKHLLERYFHLASTTDLLGMANKALDETRKDTISIAMALQVQDITSQQIAGVVHLIESVRAQLLVALRSLDEENPIGPSANASGNNHSSIPSSFDIDATFSQSTERQAIADDVVKTWNGSTQQPLE